MSMDIVLCLVAIICTYRIKFASEWHSDYMSKEKTTAINGIFVLFVFFRHFTQYIEYGSYDAIFQRVDSWLGQLIVVSFFFYSGYGGMVSIVKKGEDYIHTMPKKRIFRVWYHFAIAVAMFAVVNVIMKNSYDFKVIALSFTGWESIGNSNWYIFAILFMYIVTYMAFRIFKTNHLSALIMVVVSCGIYILLLHGLQKGDWWYNTIISYPAGMFYAKYKNKIESIVWKSKYIYLAFIGAVIGIGMLAFSFCYKFIMYECLCIAFISFIVLLTMKISIKNEILEFLGRYTFEIYVLQRIPMILFKDIINNTYVYFCLCLLVTIIIAMLFKKITHRLDSVFIK